MKPFSLTHKPCKRMAKNLAKLFTRRNIHAIILGPGEHLKGRVLMNGTMRPGEVPRYILWMWYSLADDSAASSIFSIWEMSRIHARGCHDGAVGGTSDSSSRTLQSLLFENKY
jgi:hypothetical protein